MSRVREWIGLALLALLPAAAPASCFEQAADYYQIPQVLLRAIAYYESGLKPHLVHTNTSGSKDIGLMQINELWLPALAKQGIQRADLFDGCVNTFAGAWILAQNLPRAQGDVWQAVGAYNAGWRDTPERRARKAKYVLAIQHIVERMQKETLAALSRRERDS